MPVGSARLEPVRGPSYGHWIGQWPTPVAWRALPWTLRCWIV